MTRSFLKIEDNFIGPEALRQLQAGAIRFTDEDDDDEEDSDVSSLHPCVLGQVVYQADRIDPGWRTGEVMRLAGQARKKADPGILPVLADALEDAGCTDVDILNHCRMPGKHRKGCWVVELLTASEKPGGTKGKKKRKKE
jgi:hypothetical protein